MLDHGYGATTVDAVVARAGITKGAFFHHFGSKAELARALVDRHGDLVSEHLAGHLARARKLASDPLQQLLVLLGLFEEDFEAHTEPYTGCLFAAYIYENKLFDDATLEVLRESTRLWRATLGEMLEQVVATHPPKIAVDLESLADLFYALIEGSYIITKTLGDKTLLARHTRHLRHYLELLFA